MVALEARRPPHENVLDIPTPPQQQAAVAIVFLFPALALTVFSLRTYSRLTTRQWGLDDWLCGTGLLCSLLMTGPFYMYVKLMYFGWRAPDVPEDWNPSAGMWWFYLAQMLYNPILAFVRSSVLVFLLRLGGQKRGVFWTIHVINALNIAMAIAIFLVALLQCLPISANWDDAVMAEATCVDNSFHVIISCLNVLFDFLVLALPFWIFLGLKMPLAARLAVICIFLVGSVVVIVAIMRLVAVYKLFYGTPDPDADPFYDIGTVLNVIEVNLAILSASGPALRPLFRKWWPKMFGGTSANSKSTGMQYYASGTRGRNTVHQDDIRLKNMRASRTHTEIRSNSPAGSEEEIMTYNGIIRTTNVQMTYESNASVADSQASSEVKNGKDTQEKGLAV